MTPEQLAYLQALADVRSWHRWQIGQALGDVRAVQAHAPQLLKKNPPRQAGRARSQGRHAGIAPKRVRRPSCQTVNKKLASRTI